MFSMGFICKTCLKHENSEKNNVCEFFEISMYQAASLTSGEYKGAFFLAHAIIMVSVGLPLSYLLSVIGQFSGSGVLQGML